MLAAKLADPRGGERMRKPHLTTLAMAFLAASSLASTAQAGDLTLVQTSSAEAAARPATEYTTTFLIHGVRSRALSLRA